MKSSAILKEKKLIWWFVMVLQMSLGYMTLMNTFRGNSCLQHLISPHMYLNMEETLLPKFFEEKMSTLCMVSSRFFFPLWRYVSPGAVGVQALNLLLFVRITLHQLDMYQQCATLCSLTQASSKGWFLLIKYSHICFTHSFCRHEVIKYVKCLTTLTHWCLEFLELIQFKVACFGVN